MVFEIQFHLKQFYDLTKSLQNHITFEFVRDLSSIYEYTKAEKKSLEMIMPII